ncbi:hypothetical protein [Streptomyces sp. NPDC051909]|uniref:hypothetical protein n=1 Tax=Streptomyces sp. NPDC051909 TaxID=3154944 RepID=UPI003435B2D9
MWRRKRRPGLMVVTLVALCLGGALTACGGSDDGEGYAAVGAGQTGPKGAVQPSGAVTLVPLDPKATGPELTSSTSRPSPGPPASDTGTGSRTGTVPGGTATAPPPVSGAPAPPRTPGSPATTPATPAKPPASAPPAPAPTSTAPPTKPPAPAPTPEPALLTLSAPVLTDTDRRWCENVTVGFRNTGGTAARSGTVTFATHVIGALGIDWATLSSSQPLPAPIQAGTTRTQTYTVCVDSWRVPLGMHVDTQKVTASWR